MILLLRVIVVGVVLIVSLVVVGVRVVSGSTV